MIIVFDLDSLRAVSVRRPTARSRVDRRLGFALETQTSSMLRKDIVGSGVGTANQVILHKLAHQWFGDSGEPLERGRTCG